LDWLPIITTNTYERSKKAVQILQSTETENNKYLLDKLTACSHNIKMYENLDIEHKMKQGTVAELDSLGDYSKLFYLDNSDMQSISEIISASLGLTIAAISDTHHLLASDVQPQLPHIIKKYFGYYANQEVLNGFVRMYDQTYLKIASEFKDAEGIRALQRKEIKQLLIGNENSNTNGEDDILLIIQDEVFKKWKVELFGQNALDYYLNHFTLNDIDFITALMPSLDGNTQRRIQIKISQLNKQ
jgi:hypothetical protein